MQNIILKYQIFDNFPTNSKYNNIVYIGFNVPEILNRQTYFFDIFTYFIIANRRHCVVSQQNRIYLFLEIVNIILSK